ncbi:MAG: LPS export ABC transporter permease LptG [Pseudomonadota bacterium]
MTTLNKYIFVLFARNILGIYILILSLIYLVDFVEHLRRASDDEGVSIWRIVHLVALHGPSLAEQVFPFAVLIGAMASFFMLSRSLELVVARAAGISAWQFIMPGAVFAVILGVFATTVYSPIAASMREAYETLRIETFGGRDSVFARTRGGGFWLRQRGDDGQSVIQAASASDAGVYLTDVTVYIFDRNEVFVERIDADTAELRANSWNLTNTLVSTPAGDQTAYSEYVISTYLSATQVREIFGSAESVSFWDLPSVIDASLAAGLPATGFKLQYHVLFAQPFAFMAMVFLAATVSLRIFRLGNVLRMILAGIVAGFVLYIFGQILRDLGSSGSTTPLIASWLPAIVTMMASVTVLLHLEDG